MMYLIKFCSNIFRFFPHAGEILVNVFPTITIHKEEKSASLVNKLMFLERTCVCVYIHCRMVKRRLLANYCIEGATNHRRILSFWIKYVFIVKKVNFSDSYSQN